MGYQIMRGLQLRARSLQRKAIFRQRMNEHPVFTALGGATSDVQSWEDEWPWLETLPPA